MSVLTTRTLQLGKSVPRDNVYFIPDNQAALSTAATSVKCSTSFTDKYLCEWQAQLLAEMNICKQRGRDLVTAYDCSLEQQIVGQGSSLACRDDELWKQVEGLLRDGDAQETHCLGLDPLRVMEESLIVAASTAAASTGRVKARGGLQGLAKAFEVMEQAALNLCLGHWREEYKVVKMYSGLFTHHIKPVLSMPQIEELFGLLGYQPSLPRYEQLCLQPSRVSPASLADLLRLSCAFFLARCECRLLLTALGKHAGEVKWELSVVRERQRGNSLQVALDNTQKALEVNQPLMEQFDGGVEVDLYTDEQVNGGQKGAVVSNETGTCSATWVTQSTASFLAVKSHSNGVTPSLSMSTKKHFCLSALNCQLPKSSHDLDITRSSLASTTQGRHACEELMYDKTDSQSCSLQAEAVGICKSEFERSHFCHCPQSPCFNQKVCIECNSLHNNTCAFLEHCYKKSHHVVSTNNMTKLRAVSPQGGGLNMSTMSESPTLTSSRAAMSSLVLCEDAEPIHSLHPIAYHDCCDLTQLDPQVLCLSCSVFHSGSCTEIDFCKNHHDIKPLGVCSCGRTCLRKPIVLCRYCGNEYCRECWYRSPVMCDCGQTFDQSSSV